MIRCGTCRSFYHSFCYFLIQGRDFWNIPPAIFDCHQTPQQAKQEPRGAEITVYPIPPHGVCAEVSPYTPENGLPGHSTDTREVNQ